MTDATNGNTRKQLHVFAILERKDAGKPAFWMKVGAAFPNRDGSLTLYLDAFPIGTNKLQVREARSWEDSRHGPGRDPGAEAETTP